MENTNNDNFITDEQLLVLLDSKEAGKSFPDALSAIAGVSFTHDETKVLRSIWDMHSNLMHEAHNISPRRTLLSRIIEESEVAPNENVTAGINLGYTRYGAKGTFISLRNNFQSIMEINWKIAAPIAVIVIGLVAVMNTGGQKTGQLAVNNVENNGGETQVVTMAAGDNAQTMMAMKVAPMASVSGSVDDLVAQVTSEGDGDLLLIEGSAEDAALITVDNQSVNDFNTTYDETTF